MKKVKFGKDIDRLIEHINNNHQIQLKSERQKKELLNMGYFHSYKAYLFQKNPVNKLPIQNFDEIEKIYRLDNNLKALIYSKIMMLETAIKARVITCIVSNNESSIYSIINNEKNNIYKSYNSKKVELKLKKQDFENKLSTHEFDNGEDASIKHNIQNIEKSIKILNTNYKKQNKSILELQNRIDSIISRDYSQSGITQHYMHKNESIPLWAYFELITFGDLGKFLSCLTEEMRVNICKAVKIYDSRFSPNILTNSVYLLKDLRNAVAHNKVIFDCRFKTNRLNKELRQFFNRHLLVDVDITFQSITDYILTICYFLKSLEFANCEISTFFNEYKKIIFELKNDNSFNKQIFDKLFNDIEITKINKFSIDNL